MIRTPKKLKTAAIKMAVPGLIERVDTQVAIAFGASVQPFTKMTPSVNKVMINNAGLDIVCSKKLINVIVIFSPLMSLIPMMMIPVFWL
ncbi:MAG: hypothetical protein ACOX4S_09575 [Anaerovoracaceae bacterium]